MKVRLLDGRITLACIDPTRVTIKVRELAPHQVEANLIDIDIADEDVRRLAYFGTILSVWRDSIRKRWPWPPTGFDKDITDMVPPGPPVPPSGPEKT